MMPKVSGAGKAAPAKFDKTSPVSGFSGALEDTSGDGSFADRLGAFDRPTERAPENSSERSVSRSGDKSARPTRATRREDDQETRVSNDPATNLRVTVPHAAVAQEKVPQMTAPLAKPADETAQEVSALDSAVQEASAPESAIPQSSPQAAPINRPILGAVTTGEESDAEEITSPEKPAKRQAAAPAKGEQNIAREIQQSDTDTETLEVDDETPDMPNPLGHAEFRRPAGGNDIPVANENFKIADRPRFKNDPAQGAVGLEQAKQTQVQVRRQAMQNFMAHMQNEFGIPPEKIVDAFARMDDSSLMRPPEESAKNFLANLEVPPSQQGKAAELYHQMLNTTGEAALNEKIIGRESGLQMRVLSPREEALRKLNESIDQLNDSFAMRNTKVMASQSAPMDSVTKAQLAVDQMNSELLKMERNSRAAAMPSGEESDDSGDLLGANLPEREPSARGSAATAWLGGGATAAGGFESMNNGAGNANDWQRPSGRGGAIGPATESITNAGPRFKVPAQGENPKTAGGRKPAGETESLTANSEATAASADPNALAGAGNAMPGAEKATASTGPSAMMINRPAPSAQDEKDNVKELIRQAQLAVKKGGGEIKMDLKPEGMGQIKLKVSVENGQVNVQMLTESDAAKRLLEKGIHELKSNLAAEQLKVDTMKVDVGRELQKHMDNGADQQREQTRQFANDVMSQMRDQRQAFQQGFMENRGWRQYPRGNDGGAATGVEHASRGGTASPAEARNRTRRADAGRLDLVA